LYNYDNLKDFLKGVWVYDMSVYREGVMGLFAEFSVKEYASHSGIMATDITEARNTKKVYDVEYFQKGKAFTYG